MNYVWQQTKQPFFEGRNHHHHFSTINNHVSWLLWASLSTCQQKRHYLLVFGILTNNPSTTVLLPHLLQNLHQSHHLTGLWNFWWVYWWWEGPKYWKLGMELLDYCAEETLIGTYLCKRLWFGHLFNNKIFLQQTCSVAVLFLEYISFLSERLFIYYWFWFGISIQNLFLGLLFWYWTSVRSILLVSTRDYDYIAENKRTNGTNLTCTGGQKGDKLSTFRKNIWK